MKLKPLCIILIIPFNFVTPAVQAKWLKVSASVVSLVPKLQLALVSPSDSSLLSVSIFSPR